MVNTHSLQEKILMTNSDNTFGTFNKRTQILSQVNDGSTVATAYDDADTAKAAFYTANALTVFDECCTEIQWALVNDSLNRATRLKYTMTFGTKGTADISEADDWAGQFNSRKTTLIDAGDWAKLPYTTAESSDHIF
jgi:hypothetical protein